MNIFGMLQAFTIQSSTATVDRNEAALQSGCQQVCFGHRIGTTPFRGIYAWPQAPHFTRLRRSVRPYRFRVWSAASRERPANDLASALTRVDNRLNSFCV